MLNTRKGSVRLNAMDHLWKELKKKICPTTSSNPSGGRWTTRCGGWRVWATVRPSTKAACAQRTIG